MISPPNWFSPTLMNMLNSQLHDRDVSNACFVILKKSAVFPLTTLVSSASLVEEIGQIFWRIKHYFLWKAQISLIVGGYKKKIKIPHAVITFCSKEFSYHRNADFIGPNVHVGANNWPSGIIHSLSHHVLAEQAVLFLQNLITILKERQVHVTVIFIAESWNPFMILWLFQNTWFLSCNSPYFSWSQLIKLSPDAHPGICQSLLYPCHCQIQYWLSSEGESTCCIAYLQSSVLRSSTTQNCPGAPTALS